MLITSVTIQGESGREVSIKLVDGLVTIDCLDGTELRATAKALEDDGYRYSVARSLQRWADGVTGTRSEVREFDDLLLRFAS